MVSIFGSKWQINITSKRAFVWLLSKIVTMVTIPTWVFVGIGYTLVYPEEWDNSSRAPRWSFWMLVALINDHAVSVPTSVGVVCGTGKRWWIWSFIDTITSIDIHCDLFYSIFLWSLRYPQPFSVICFDIDTELSMQYFTDCCEIWRMVMCQDSGV